MGLQLETNRRCIINYVATIRQYGSVVCSSQMYSEWSPCTMVMWSEWSPCTIVSQVLDALAIHALCASNGTATWTTSIRLAPCVLAFASVERARASSCVCVSIYVTTLSLYCACVCFARACLLTDFATRLRWCDVWFWLPDAVWKQNKISGQIDFVQICSFSN